MRSKNDVTEIIQRIILAARWYKENVVGRTFLILYEGKHIKVQFKTENFLHLCGVDTTLYAKEFYKKAVNGTLNSHEIGFSNIHPYVFAEIKTKNIINALSILRRESFVITDIFTKSRFYKLGTTDLEVVICFDVQLDNNGNQIKNIFIPYSLRVEEIANNRYNELYEVDYVLSKRTNERGYSQVEYGDSDYLMQYFDEHGICDYNIDSILETADGRYCDTELEFDR